MRVFGPDKERRGLILLGQVLVERCNEGLYAWESAASDALPRDLTEPALDHIEPRTAVNLRRPSPDAGPARPERAGAGWTRNAQGPASESTGGCKPPPDVRAHAQRKQCARPEHYQVWLPSSFGKREGR